MPYLPHSGRASGRDATQGSESISSNGIKQAPPEPSYLNILTCGLFTEELENIPEHMH